LNNLMNLKKRMVFALFIPMLLSVMIVYPTIKVFAAENKAEVEQTEQSLEADQYLGDQTEAKVYDDFQNDIWVQFQQKKIDIDETVDIYPWRLEQAISSVTQNDVERPLFNFEIISGESVTLNTTSSTNKALATGVKAGTSIIKITYDALNHSAGESFEALSPVNTAYVAITVGETGEATILSSIENWRHYDTVYFDQGETLPYEITVDTEQAEQVVVSCNGIRIEKQNGTYTLPLENRTNIIGVVATDANGNTTTQYRMMDARFIKINITNKTHPDGDLAVGDTANVSFEGIKMPVYKLATIYNPQMAALGDATRTVYSNDTFGQVEGLCDQYDLATHNSFDITFTKSGNYTFKDGYIQESWWGSDLGADLETEGQGEENLAADAHTDVFSTLPDFTISIPGAYVTVSIVDEIPTPASETWPAAKGSILNAYQVAIYDDDNMMDAVLRACEENNIEIEASYDKQKNSSYIESIDGLSELDRGSGSGWMGSLNDWFTNFGFSQYKVSDGTLEDGDSIQIEYTTNYGMDLTDANAGFELASFEVSEGSLDPTFSADQLTYQLNVSPETETVIIHPILENRNNQIELEAFGQSFKKTQGIAVINGLTINMNIEKKASFGKDPTPPLTQTKTITINTGEKVDYGNINQDTSVNSADALLLLKQSVNLVDLPLEDKVKGDVVKNDKINSADALKVLQYSVKLIDSITP